MEGVYFRVLWKKKRKGGNKKLKLAPASPVNSYCNFSPFTLKDKLINTAQTTLKLSKAVAMMFREGVLEGQS